MSHSFPEDAAEMLQSYIDSSDGFLSRMGAEVVKLTRDRTRVRLEYSEDVANATQKGWLHGGAIATLVDSAGGLALRPYLDNPVRDGVATVSMNVDYLDAATDDVVAEAEVLRAGGTVGFSRVEVIQEEDRDRVAAGRGAYRLFTNED